LSRAIQAIVVSVPLTFGAACASEGQAVRNADVAEVYLGPDQVQMIDLPKPPVLYSIGDSVGPGMLTEGRGLLMAPAGDGEVLVYTSFAEAIQLFRNGQIVSQIGRLGSGPGEFTGVNGFAVDPQAASIWVLDRGNGRLVSFSRDGTPGEVVAAAHAGASAQRPILLTDGSLLLNGKGSNWDNLGYLIHRYDPKTGQWSSHHPVLRDSAFGEVSDRRWIRSLAAAPNGMLVAVSHDYVIEVLDPRQDFRLVAKVRRRPSSWPEDIIGENARRVREDPVSPRYNVTNAWVDMRNRLWVLASMPDRQWRDKVGPDPRPAMGSTKS
jgi:hypothetical protein